MPLTYSIATGIGLGFITYALAKLIAGKVQEASPAVLVLAVLFAVKFDPAFRAGKSGSLRSFPRDRDFAGCRSSRAPTYRA